ncbi:MAG: SDR family oxidoreductase [Clostridia bacterium]|nr:SDR family oxidoreductase [Clostridia bacterium]
MKVCLVTGITGTLGSELTETLKSNDYFVIGLSRKIWVNADACITCDFTNLSTNDLKESINNVISNLKEINQIDFVHCAGYYEKERKFDSEFNESLCEKTFSINVFSFYKIVNILTEICEKYKVKSSVVAVSSNLTIKKNTLTAPYISSKIALEGMVQSFAQTYGSLDMRFNCVCPGMFASNMNEYNVPEQFINNTPLKRLGKVDDIIDSIMFLLSDKSNCITANKLVVDGGGSNGY